MASPALIARVAAQIRWPGAVVVERGRGHIVHRHPTDPAKFMVDTQVGGVGWHYGPALDQEVDTAWEATALPWNYRMVKAGFNAYLLSQLNSGMVARYADPATGEYVEFQPMNLQWANDLQTQFIESPQAVNAVINDDLARWPNGYGAGRHFSWQTQTARFEKLLTIDSLASLPSANAVIRGGANPGLELQLIFRRSAGVGVWVNGTRWDTGGHADRSTSGLVEFRLLSDQTTVLWWFNLPRSWDSDGKEVLGTFRFRRAGQTLNVYHRIPLAWIEDPARVWPIMVDTTVDEQVGAGGDDCYIWGTTGFDNTDTATYFGRWNSTYNKQENASRFTTVAIDQAATIDVSYLSFYSSGNFTNTVPAKIYGEDADNPGAIADRTDYDSRAITTAYASWSPGNFTADTWYNSADISIPLQEVVDRVGFASGNSIGVFCGDRAGDVTSDASNRGVRTREHSTTLAPKLHVEYTAGGATLDVAGGITPAGALSRQPRTTRSGSITPSGAHIKLVTTSLSGEVASEGALAKAPRSMLSGSIAIVGTLAKQVRTLPSGAIAGTGELAKQVRSNLIGVISSSGNLLKQARINLSGAITLSGALETLSGLSLSVGGTIALVGTLTNQARINLSGSVVSVGSLLNQARIGLDGVVQGAGDLSKAALTSLAGSIASAGDVVKQARINLSGVIIPSGALSAASSLIQLAVGGTIALAGTLTNQVRINLSGAVTLAGALTTGISGILLKLFSLFRPDLTLVSLPRTDLTLASVVRADLTLVGQMLGGKD